MLQICYSRNPEFSGKVTCLQKENLTSPNGALTKFKKNVEWAIDKFRLNNSLAINGKILRFEYGQIAVQRRPFSNFYDFAVASTK